MCNEIEKTAETAPTVNSEALSQHLPAWAGKIMKCHQSCQYPG